MHHERTNDLSALRRNAGATAAILRALANEPRLMILCLLIAFRREAQTVHSRIVDPEAKRLIATLKTIYCD